MGRDIKNFFNKNSPVEGDKTPPSWPQIGEYKENGVTIRVFKSAWLKGAVMDYRSRSARKGKH